MKQSVSAAQIDECTKICNVLNNTLYCIANMDTLHKLLLFLSFLSNKKLFAVTDDTASSWVELCDNELDLLICIFGKIFLICVRYKACRNEYSCFLNIDTKTTVKYLCYRSLQNLLVLECLLKTFVAFLCCKTFVGKCNLSLSVVYFENLCFHGIARFNNVCKHNA